MSKILASVIAPFILLLSTTHGKEKLFDFKVSQKSIEDYFKVEQKFAKELCPGGTEEKFNRLYKDYLGKGYFVPLLSDHEIDLETIRKNFNLLKEKKDWIDGLTRTIPSEKDFGRATKELLSLKSALKTLLDLKEDYFFEDKKQVKQKYRLQSKYAFLRFRARMRKFIETHNYLHTFQFPVDHFSMRAEYDGFKSRKDIPGKKKSNDIYFRRKIIEDGARDLNSGRSDRYYRSIINSVYLGLNDKKLDLIDEDLRYDLFALFPYYKKVFSQNPQQIVSKLAHWSKLTDEHYNFYKSILENKIELNKKRETVKSFLTKKAEARYLLEDFNYKKQVEVYRFWSAQPEILRSLYVLESILFNEVGGLDGRLGQERESVSQVVLNRRLDPYYSRLPDDDPLRGYLEKAKLDQKMIDDPWLAVLFKRGEFSFTYFFIEASVRVYCLDQTKRGRRLRRENLRISSDALNNPDWGFLGMRYFSRHSMLGRIKMNKLWKNYQALPERPGRRVIKSYKLKARFDEGLYQYLDSFSYRGKTYDVLQFGKSTYVKLRHFHRYFYYRNPHYFTYFRSN